MNDRFGMIKDNELLEVTFTITEPNEKPYLYIAHFTSYTEAEKFVSENENAENLVLIEYITKVPRESIDLEKIF